MEPALHATLTLGTLLALVAFGYTQMQLNSSADRLEDAFLEAILDLRLRVEQLEERKSSVESRMMDGCA